MELSGDNQSPEASLTRLGLSLEPDLCLGKLATFCQFIYGFFGFFFFLLLAAENEGPLVSFQKDELAYLSANDPAHLRQMMTISIHRSF